MNQSLFDRDYILWGFMSSQKNKEFIYIPISTETILLAAKLWAEVRQRGQATAAPKSLDGHVILAAQALLQAKPLSLHNNLINLI